MIWIWRALGAFLIDFVLLNTQLDIILPHCVPLFLQNISFYYASWRYWILSIFSSLDMTGLSGWCCYQLNRTDSKIFSHLYCLSWYGVHPTQATSLPLVYKRKTRIWYSLLLEGFDGVGSSFFWLQLKVIIYLRIQVLLLSNLYFCAEAIRPKGVIKCSKKGNEKNKKGLSGTCLCDCGLSRLITDDLLLPATIYLSISSWENHFLFPKVMHLGC